MATQTPQYALPYPESFDTPDVPYFQQVLAQAVENTLATRFQRGVVAITGDSTNAVKTTVTFPTPFATPPTVVATPGGANAQFGQSHLYATVEDATTHSVVIGIGASGAGQVVGVFPYRIEWIATNL